MNDMGNKIYNLRISKGMSLEELGNKVGVGKSTVRKWEKGIIANMRRDKIALIAAALDVSPAYLMGWTEEEHIEAPTFDIRHVQIITLFEMLSESDKEMIINLMTSLSKK